MKQFQAYFIEKHYDNLTNNEEGGDGKKSTRPGICAWLILLGLLWTSVIITWSLIDYSTKSSHLIELESEILSVALNTSHNADFTLQVHRRMGEKIIQKNKELSSTHVGSLNGILRDETRDTTNEIGQIVKNSTEKIENELNSFNEIIFEAVESLANTTEIEFSEIFTKIAGTNFSDPANATIFLNDTIDILEFKIAEVYVSLYNIYGFYATFAPKELDPMIQDGANLLAKIARDFRKKTRGLKNRIDFCYELSEQNRKTAYLIDNSVAMLEIISNATSIVGNLNDAIEENSSLCPLEREYEKRLDFILEITKNKNYFLGEVLKRESAHFTKFQKQKLRKFENFLTSYAKNLNETVSKFDIAVDFHRDKLASTIKNLLENFQNTILKKLTESNLASHPEISEIIEKLSFENTKIWLNEKFDSFKEDINSEFDWRMNEILNDVKTYLEFLSNGEIIEFKLFSNQFYIPTTLCSFSVNYHSVAKSVVENYLKSVCIDLEGKKIPNCQKSEFSGEAIQFKSGQAVNVTTPSPDDFFKLQKIADGYSGLY